MVVSGSATVCGGCATEVVRQGGAFLISSEELHIVENRSSDTPLVVFSAYWTPRERTHGAPEEAAAHV